MYSRKLSPWACRLVFGVAVVCWALAGGASALAQPKSTWYITPNVSNVPLGSIVNLDIWLDVGDNIPADKYYKAVQAELGWNGTIVAATQVTSHISFWTPAGFCSNSSFILRTNSFFTGRAVLSQLSTAAVTCNNVRTPFKLFTVPFKANAVGQTAVEFTEFTRLVFRATPTEELDTDFITINAVINVFDPNPPTPTPTSTPSLPDADQDGVPDIHEGYPPIAGQSNKWLPDSDGDGLGDGVEDANRNGVQDTGETSTRNRDTDGDRYVDGIEVNILGTNPLDAGSPALAYLDVDNDNLPAAQDSDDTIRDVDGDRYTDGYEAAHLGLAAATNGAVKPTLGDLNNDTFVSNLDALIANAVFLGNVQPGNIAGIRNADAGRDGQISNLDALIINSYFLQTIPTLPPPGL